ncbi:MAG: TIGR01212 family radical SAM protein [Bacteroidales bacterium]
MIYPWGHKRRFNSYSEYFKKQFGERVQKVSVDAGFTCPNRDGKLAKGGCTYCNNDAFNPSYCQPVKSIRQQVEEGIEFHKRRYRRANKYLAYFQAYSNTYASLEELIKKYNEALSFPYVIGLVIGTRPDCIDDEKLAWLSELSKKYYIILEYGIESCYNKTLQRINRQHTWEQSVKAITKTHEYGIKTGAHLIFGLPGESRQEMLAEAEILSQLPLGTIKFHQLQIIRDTVMAQQYKNKPEDFDLFSLEEYIEFIIRFVERLNPELIIERFTGEVPPRFLSGPNWGIIRNDEVNYKIEKTMEEKDTWQGKFFK